MVNYLEKIIMSHPYPENMSLAYQEYINHNYRRYKSKNIHDIDFYLRTFNDAITEHKIHIVTTTIKSSMNFQKAGKKFNMQSASVSNLVRDFFLYMNFCDEFYDKYMEEGDNISLSIVDSRLYHRLRSKLEDQLTLKYFKDHYLDLDIFCEPYNWNILLAKQILNPNKHRRLRYCLGKNHPFFRYCEEKIEEGNIYD